MVRALLLSLLLLPILAVAQEAPLMQEAISRAQERNALNAEERAEVARLRKTRQVWVFSANPKAEDAGVITASVEGRVYRFGAIKAEPHFWKGKGLRDRDARLMFEQMTGGLEGHLSAGGKVYAIDTVGRFSVLMR